MKVSLQKAFTIIELLVVIALILLISSVGLISYSNINKKQSVIQQAKNIASLIQLAQNNANSQKKPEESCYPLSSYTFTFIRSNNTYKIEAKCGGTDHLIKFGSVNTDIPVNKNFTITFNLQTKDVVFDEQTATTGIKVTVGDADYKNYLIVCKGGVIQIKDNDPGDSYCP